MTGYLGDFAAGATVHFGWDFATAEGESVAPSTAGSLRVYKDGSITQRTSASGITDSRDFDGLAGNNHCAIDLSDNADAGFYATGHEFSVRLVGALTGEGKTINRTLAHFAIERSGAVLALVKAGVTLANASLTAAKFAANAIDAGALASDAVTEIQSGLATAAAIAALNNLSSAQAQTAAAAALTAYDVAQPGDVPTAVQNADALLDRASAVDTYTPRQAFRLMLALLTGEITFSGNIATIKAADGSKTRATFETNPQEERLNGVLDAT